ncbi:MAG TPA: hypothetical protein VM287_08870 [Egibacteraceae bacterium]|nr:hypothetical protein [Egibacteraceae bacterium]
MSAPGAPVERTVGIPARYNGPPASGNGGYVCGRVAAAVDGPAEVTLHVPPPLERPLSLIRTPGGAQLHDGDTLIADAVPTTVDLRPPAIVTLADAERAAAGYPGFSDHAFPTCFVCGPQRAAGDGLRVFVGPVAGAHVAAAPWTPAPDLADSAGVVRPEVVWAALDCPSYFGGPVGVLAVLGRLAVDIRAPVIAGQPHVVLGWGRGSERRKHFAAAAITDGAGNLLAVSRATWIELREPPPVP